MPEYLSQSDHPTDRVRCAVHGFIRYSRNERKIIDHPVFSRLRNIKQLALDYYLYPGAMHTRFEHSLGVMEMATRAFDTIVMKREALVQEELRQIPAFRDQALAKARQTLRLMALLHDVGHPAFSHAAETVIPDFQDGIESQLRGQKHEQMSLFIINRILRELLDQTFFQGITDILVRLMQKSPELTLLRQFVAGDIDMDRTDYLRRDSLHCGVDYGHFDFLRLIESLTLIRDPDSHQLHLAIQRGGEHVYEAMILARYQMNTQVYYHRLRRIYDFYLTSYMTLWGPGNYRTHEDVLKHDDMSVLMQMRADAQSANGEQKNIAARIVQRNHHKRVYETGDGADVIKLRQIKRVFEEISGRFTEADLILDKATASIHKQPVPDDQGEDTDVDPLYVVDKDGVNPVLISEESSIIRKIPKKFQNVRVFAAAPPAQIAELRQAFVDGMRG